LLLGSFPNFQSGDAEAALGAYEIVLTEADERDLQPGVMKLIHGELPGHDGRFAPTAPQLARAIRTARDERLDREHAERAALPKPDDTWVDDDPETKVRNKARFEALAAQLAQTMRTDEAEANKRRMDLQDRTNHRFAPDPSPEARAKRLGVPYTVGDPDAENGDMGQAGAA